MTEKAACRKCAAPLTRPDIGRPPTYCSRGCRRAAEYEIRRASRRLEALEGERDEYQRQLTVLTAHPHQSYDQERLQAALDATAATIDRYEARLRQLLDDGDDS